MVLKSAMKWGILLILCILLSPIYVSAEKVRLSIGESHVKMDVNITLAKIDKGYDKAVICVNNEKQILYDNQFTYFKKARLKLTDIDAHDKTVEISVEDLYGCYGCKCVGDCLNDLCKIQMYDEFGDLINKGETTSEVEVVGVVEDDSVEVVELRQYSYFAVIGLGVIGGLIGIGLVWLFWLRKVIF